MRKIKQIIAIKSSQRKSPTINSSLFTKNDHAELHHDIITELTIFDNIIKSSLAATFHYFYDTQQYLSWWYGVEQGTCCLTFRYRRTIPQNFLWNKEILFKRSYWKRVCFSWVQTKLTCIVWATSFSSATSMKIRGSPEENIKEDHIT